MTPLSVAIITLNEERNIRRCLDSIRGLAADILIVDSGSSDRTVQIAQEAGARVVEHAFEGHIQQKNFALSRCQHEWVLSIDADEAVSETLRDSILRVLEQPTIDGYRMNRLTNYCGSWIRHGGWYPDKKLRLFCRTKGVWTGLNPHDRFELYAPGAQTGQLDGDLLHYSYRSVSDHLRQIDYFTDITARELHRRGESAPLWKVVIAPPFRFLRDYVLKGGWLDGFHGFVIASLSAGSVLVKYTKLRHLAQEDHTNG